MSNSFVTPWTVAYQALLSVGFPRQEYWSGLPHFFQGIFPTQVSNQKSPAWQVDSLPLTHQGSQRCKIIWIQNYGWHLNNMGFSSVQFSSVLQSCPTFCDPMNRSMPGLPIHHQLLEFTQTHVHRVSDAIQPSHPLSSPSPPAPNPSQH